MGKLKTKSCETAGRPETKNEAVRVEDRASIHRIAPETGGSSGAWQTITSVRHLSCSSREGSIKGAFRCRVLLDAEFCSKLDGLLQEADESQLWLELLIEDCQLTDQELKDLHGESNEIIAIFSTIVSKVRCSL